MVFGVGQLRETPVDVFPEFAPPLVEIQTACPGCPRRGRELVTVPLEQALNGMPGLDAMRSKSVPQLSSIVLIFEPGTDLTGAPGGRRSGVGSVMPDAADLGGAAGHPAAALVDQPGHEDRAVRPTTLSLIDLSMLAYWTIRPRLMASPAWRTWPSGASGMQMLQVQVDPERLRAQRRHARRRSWRRPPTPWTPGCCSTRTAR